MKQLELKRTALGANLADQQKTLDRFQKEVVGRVEVMNNMLITCQHEYDDGESTLYRFDPNSNQVVCCLICDMQWVKR